MKTPRQVIAEAMDEEKMMYNSDEANADQIIAALHNAGYEICAKGVGAELFHKVITD